MDFFGKGKEADIPVNVSINSIHRIKDFLKDYFQTEKIEDMHDSLYDGMWTTLVSDSEISREDFNKFLYAFAEHGEFFEITIDSNKGYVSENYRFNPGDDFITKESIPEKYCNKTGLDCLVGMVFHSQSEKIELKDLKGN